MRNTLASRRRISAQAAAAGLLLFFCFARQARSGNSGLIEALSVSPDGKFLAVVYAKAKNEFIYKIALDTGKASRLTDAKTGHESSPAFSPDGKLIAFTYSPDDNAPARIVVANADGSRLHSWPPSKIDDFWPVFSPDHKAIVFARSGFYGAYSPIAQPHYHEWVFYEAGLDGTNVRQLTNGKFFAVSPPSVSPDGKSMMLMTVGPDTPPPDCYLFAGATRKAGPVAQAACARPAQRGSHIRLALLHARWKGHFVPGCQ